MFRMAPAASGKSERGVIMTKEKAIRHFERYINDDCYTIEHRDACRMAISALREQEERERGCEYCNDCKSICNQDEDIHISGNILRIDIGCYAYSSVKINFCPMCGRRLYFPIPTTAEANS